MIQGSGLINPCYTQNLKRSTNSTVRSRSTVHPWKWLRYR
jgi:hypothetical protein